jgi:hypothetical protein
MSERCAANRRVPKRTRRLLVFPAIVGFVIAGAMSATAQKKYPTYTADDFVKSMKTIGRAYGAVTNALATNDFDTAKAQLTRSREQLAITITFWRDRKKDDAVKMLRDTVSKMDDLDAALSAVSIDATKVGGLAKQVGAGCQACHAAYREQDPATKAYTFNLDAVR